MQRFAMEKLIEWKDSVRRKPLLLLGARQVGKTWLMQEFGRNCFRNTAYIRFDKNQQMRAAFERDYDISIWCINFKRQYQPSGTPADDD